MNKQLEAWRARMARNDMALFGLACDLLKHECKCYKSPNKPLMEYIVVIKEGLHVVIGFKEVPYSWYADQWLVPSEKFGSSHRITTTNNFNEIFKDWEVLALMTPIPSQKVLEDHMKFLEEINPVGSPMNPPKDVIEKDGQISLGLI